jgi:hypothetical protein
MYPTPPVAWPPRRRGVNPWLIVSLVLGVVVVLPVMLIASVTLLGSNAESKFRDVGTSVSSDPDPLPYHTADDCDAIAGDLTDAEYTYCLATAD